MAMSCSVLLHKECCGLLLGLDLKALVWKGVMYFLREVKVERWNFRKVGYFKGIKVLKHKKLRQKIESL